MGIVFKKVFVSRLMKQRAQFGGKDKWLWWRNLHARSYCTWFIPGNVSFLHARQLESLSGFSRGNWIVFFILKGITEIEYLKKKKKISRVTGWKSHFLWGFREEQITTDQGCDVPPQKGSVGKTGCRFIAKTHTGSRGGRSNFLYEDVSNQLDLLHSEGTPSHVEVVG